MASVSDNTQTDFDNAEAIVIDMLQKARPGLSLRRGTVLRELLVRPMSEIYAADTARVNESMASRSLALMKESGTATTEEVDAILSNFSTSLYKGKNASGILFVQVSSDATYSIPNTTVFTSVDGLEFKVARTYVATSADVSGDTYLKLGQTGNGLWYFLVPVEAVSPGAEYEVAAGTRFSSSFDFKGLVSISAYAKFSGGLSAQTISEAIDELESAVSTRGFDSRTAILSTLLDRNGGGFSGIIRACSSVGYGDPEQTRDKSNVFGVATGGKVDLFVRSFSAPSVATFSRTGTWDSARQAYAIHFTHAELPGYYAVRSVTDPDVVQSPASAGIHTLLASGSYSVSEEFIPATTIFGIHSIPDAPNGTAFTAYRNVDLYVSDVNFDPSTLQDGDTKDFEVSVYAYPDIAAIQEYVDRDDVRSIKNDMLVRTAPICLVSLDASVSIPVGSTAPDLYAMRCAVADYINSRSFVSRLSASEIVAVLDKFGISRVEMMHGTSYGFRMSGRLRSANGNILHFPGPDIDISEHADPANFVSPRTVVFGANIEDISINIIGAK